MKTMFWGTVLVLCLSAFPVIVMAQTTDQTQSTAYLNISANNGSGPMVVKLVLPLTAVEESDKSMTFSNGSTTLKIAGTEDKADWSLQYKNRPYKAYVSHSGATFSRTDTETGSILKVLKVFNLSGTTMNTPTAYVVQPGSYIVLKN